MYENSKFASHLQKRMRIFNNQSELTAFLKSISNDKKTIGFVPTMGALHQGHLSLLKTALEQNAVSIILCHNHPSGILKASDQDITVTRKIKEAGRALDITILDHLIITNYSYLSFADEGIL